MNLITQLEKFREEELLNMKKDRKYGIPVRINPKSMIAKEIVYQTILLKQIIDHQKKLISLLNKLNHD